MLILVGVTINVALNGGLFTKASEASKQMQVEADRETLLSAVVAAIGYDGKVVIADIELPSGWTGSNGTYTSPKGNSFTVDENGKIENKKDSDDDEPETPDEPVSVAGSYANGNVIISDGGTGTYYGDNITYTIDENLKGTMLVDDEVLNIQFEIKENDVKILYAEGYESSNYPGDERFYNAVYTTSESYIIGEVLEDGTYTISETKEVEVVDGNGVVKEDGRADENLGKMYILGDKIYYWHSEGYSYYAKYYIINDTTLGDLWR